MTALKKFVEAARLPVMPEIASKLIETLSADSVELSYLRDVISKDPGLTATVLRWANSPLHGLSRSVTTLDAAISILGLSKIRAQAIATCVANTFELPAGMNRSTFWQQSLKSAGYSMWLALAIGLDESEAWLTGMLIHLGEVIIFRFDPEAAKSLSGKSLDAQSRWELERTVLGFDEGEVMSEYAKFWKFPKEIVTALKTATRRTGKGKFCKLGGVVHLATILSELDVVDDASLSLLPPEIVAQLGIDVQWLGQFLPDPQSFTDTSDL